MAHFFRIQTTSMKQRTQMRIITDYRHELVRLAVNAMM